MGTVPMPHIANANLLEIVWTVAGFIALIVNLRLLREAYGDRVLADGEGDERAIAARVAANDYITVHRTLAIILSMVILAGVVAMTSPDTTSDRVTVYWLILGFAFLSMPMALVRLALMMAANRERLLDLAVEAAREIDQPARHALKNQLQRAMLEVYFLTGLLTRTGVGRDEIKAQVEEEIARHERIMRGEAER